ncbi:MAG: hypothetical protein US76_03665 [Parcubacteria group bacterium GW2011_GWA2_38_13b]|nr:MAG: hypothetical protein US76_03665 [Parcubacteria group bacterium GW2011_GWA2_38_13b]
MEKGVIIATIEVAPNIFKMIIGADDIAKRIKAGQFIILMATERGERIPLTVAESDSCQGTITIFVQRAGKSTCELADMCEYSKLYSLSGPNGRASEIEKTEGSVVFVCGGVGTAVMYPVLKANKEFGNKVIAIMGVKNKELLILRDEIEKISDQTIICTDDGSAGAKGFTTDILGEFIKSGMKISKVIVAGPPIMMKLVAEITRKYAIPTVASLVTIMIDGTGMCGGCRVEINGGSKFVCCDGPEFDAHQVNWGDLLLRQRIYTGEEKISLERYKEERRCYGQG